ncbi:MAG: sugar phosphate isomerase/epimerase [Gemmataceae bacterium]|nr:sugar phosphate isomerase/epimerase [Gemmataceae bacterium]
MTLGFVSAILPDLDLDAVLAFAARTGYDCVEVMCWPPGKAERRYAGITHLDVTKFEPAKVHDLCGKHGVAISGLGYYPNPLDPDEAAATGFARHLEQVILAADRLGIRVINTFIGRDPAKTIDDNWPRMLKVWKPLAKLAEDHNVRIGIENCPMSFTKDEWPGGKNLATSPAVWRRLFADLGPHVGLNYDPSHLVLQHMCYLKPMIEFPDRLFHVHAKDLRINRAALDEYGAFAFPNLWHSPKLPGLGDVDWGKFFSRLTDTGYNGPVCVEVEDRAYEGPLERRQAALIQSHTYLRNFLPRGTAR